MGAERSEGLQVLIARKHRNDSVDARLLDEPGDLLFTAYSPVLKTRPADALGHGESVVDHPGETTGLESCSHSSHC